MDVALPSDSDLPRDVLDHLNSLPPINVYRMLTIVPQSLAPWSALTGAVYQCALDGRLREIAICRQARTARAGYELHQHRLIAANNGVSQRDLAAVLEEPVVRSLDDQANLVCRAADELETSATLPDDTQEQLYTTLGRQQATELILVLSFYSAVARFTNATRVAIEADNPLARVANPTVR
jgi:4-carboxymuconolactone decarboxylase